MVRANGGRSPRTGPLKADLFEQLGRSGLQQLGGIVVDEWSTQLQGLRGRRLLREFADEDWTAGAILFALEMLVRQVHWSMEPTDDSPEAVALAAFVDECRTDMEESWPDTLAEILTMLVYGWAYTEVVYKARMGPHEDDPTRNSGYSDGKVGWRSWAIRSQESLLRWEFDAEGTMIGLWQMPPPDFVLRYVPYSKALLFRPTVRRGNPEGRSILRNAVRSYTLKRGIETIESIGVERDLAGFPIVRAPANIVAPQTPEDQVASDAYFKMVTNIRRDEQMGALLPSTRDEKGNLEYDLALLSTGGQRQIDTSGIIERHSTAIAQTVLADFISIGHGQRGSQALAASKIELFSTSVAALLDAICGVAQRAIRWLVALNGENLDLAPTLTHGEVERTDLVALSQFILNLSQAGAELNLTKGSPRLNYLLDEANLPTDAPVDPDEGSLAPDVAPMGAPPRRAGRKPPLKKTAPATAPGQEPSQP